MAKIGRNDPCSCGSGKKYKKCCEPKEAASRKLTAHKLEGDELTKKASDISGLFKKISSVSPVLEEKVKEENLEPPTQEPTENP